MFNASPSWVVKGGVGRGYKTPRVEQLSPGINGFGNQGRLPFIGSPGLKPETSTTVELNVQYAAESGAGFAAGVFHNTFDDKIASGTPVPNCSFAASPNRPGCVDVGNWPLVDTFGQAINIDEAVTRGVELSGRLPVGERWRLAGNYTHTRSEQKSGAAAGRPRRGRADGERLHPVGHAARRHARPVLA